MTKVGIYKLGFVPIGESDNTDVWTEVVGEEVEERATPYTPEDYSTFIGKMFKSIDQMASELTEEYIDDENGPYYRIDLSSVVRKEEDIELAEKYSGQQLAIHVWTVDGRHVIIGTEADPARLATSDRYAGMNTREVALTSQYATLNGLLRS